MKNRANLNKCIDVRKYPKASLNERPSTLHTGHSDIQRILKGYYIKLKFLFYEESLLARYCNTMTISV